MSDAWTPWAVLGVDEDSPKDEVKRAYRRLAQLFHPDRNDSEAATEMMRIVNLAYRAINNGARPPRSDAHESRWALFTMPFGKYKGRTLLDIGYIDPRYLEWISDHFAEGSVLRAVRAFIVEMEERR